MNRAKLIVLLIFAVSSSCKSQYNGVYIDRTDNLFKIEIDNDLFVFRWKSGTNVSSYCIDTIAYGTVASVAKLPLLKISSLRNQYASLVNMEVQEEKGESGVTRFNIVNPIESTHSTYNSGNDSARAVEYSLIIQSDCSEFQTRVNQMLFNTNHILIPNTDYCKIRSFEIIVRPRNCLRDWNEESEPRLVYTMRYEIRSEDSNTFNVVMKELTSCFLGSKRLNGDFILINKDKSLEWDNRIFIKQ